MGKASNKKIFFKRLSVLDFFTLGCLLVNLGLIAFVVFSQNYLPPVVPLLYGLPLSEEQLVPKLFLTTPAIAAMLVVAINFLLIRTAIKNSFLQKVLVSVFVLASILSSITILKIIYLVGSL